MRTRSRYSPLSLIAELTHRCPLHCVYCSNPLQLQQASAELSTGEWARVFRQAANLGVLQLSLTGGEPLARRDLTQLVAAASAAKLYVNLITSGIGLTEGRLADLVDAGVEHLQLSFQDANEDAANTIAGARVHTQKLALASVVKKFPIAFTVNLVVHRQNLDRLEQMITMAECLAPDRLEIAHVQYYGWAWRNRSLLMPTAEQVTRSAEIIAVAKERLCGRIHLESVTPDYYALFPKPCVGGWGRHMLLITPDGRALPCHAAGVIPGLDFANVREDTLEWIWHDSPAFNRFRGDDWMAEPCRSCERKMRDFGGCRCQAFLLTGDADAADPVCSLSSQRAVVSQATLVSRPAERDARELAWAYRSEPDQVCIPAADVGSSSSVRASFGADDNGE